MPTKHPVYATLSWLKYILFALLSGFFLVFGIQVLLFAYALDDPFSFIMTFFASNLIILISAALIVVFIIRMRRSYKTRHDD